MDRKIAKILLFLFLIQLSWGYLLMPILKTRYPLKFLDNDGYLQIAQNLNAGNGYRIKKDEANTMRRMPIYPFFLYLFLKITSPENFKNIIKIIQILISISTSFIIFKILSINIRRETGYLGAFLWGINPVNILYTPRFYSENLWFFFISLSLLFFTHFFKSGNNIHLYFSMFFLSISVLTRSTSIFLIPLFLLILFFKMNIKRPSTYIKIFLIFLVAMSPWWIRNYKISHEVVITNTWTYRPILHGISIFENYGKSKMNHWELDQYFQQKYKKIVEKKIGKINTPQKEIEEEKFAKKLILKEIKKNPGLLLKNGLKGLGRIFYLSSSKLFSSVAFLYNLFLILFFIISLFSRSKEILKNPVLLFSLFAFFLFYIPYGFIYPVLRYSMPVSFFMVLISSISGGKIFGKYF